MALSPLAITTGAYEFEGEFSGLHVKILFILSLSKPNSTRHSHLARLPFILSWNVASDLCPLTLFGQLLLE